MSGQIGSVWCQAWSRSQSAARDRQYMVLRNAGSVSDFAMVPAFSGAGPSTQRALCVQLKSPYFNWTHSARCVEGPAPENAGTIAKSETDPALRRTMYCLSRAADCDRDQAWHQTDPICPLIRFGSYLDQQ